MKSIIMFCLLIFSTSNYAEWIKYSKDSEENIYYYSTERLIKDGSDVFVWDRVKVGENNELTIYGTHSVLRYSKFNCDDYSNQVLTMALFHDSEWTFLKDYYSTPSDVVFIAPGSVLEGLVEIICK